MICVLLLFCSMVVSGPVPADLGAVSVYEDSPAALVLLAHNNLDGAYFAEIDRGEMIRYHDGEEWRDYRVIEKVIAQAENPESAKTRLSVNGKWLGPGAVHQRFFSDPDSLVLFTCVYRDGNWTWGRLFIVAKEERMTNTEKIEKVFKAVKFLAELWRRFGYPVTFDRVLTIDGVDVRVIVEDVALTQRND